MKKTFVLLMLFSIIFCANINQPVNAAEPTSSQIQTGTDIMLYDAFYNGVPVTIGGNYTAMGDTTFSLATSDNYLLSTDFTLKTGYKLMYISIYSSENANITWIGDDINLRTGYYADSCMGYLPAGSTQGWELGTITNFDCRIINKSGSTSIIAIFLRGRKL